MERRRDFPGISARLEAIREYPRRSTSMPRTSWATSGRSPRSSWRSRATRRPSTGCVRPTSSAAPGWRRSTTTELRGKPGITTLAVDTAGNVTGTLDQKAPVAGDYVVTSIDAKLQTVVEQQLLRAVQRAQQQGYAGKSGAAVVDRRQDRVACWPWRAIPTYDPSIWIGGVSKKQYKELINSESLSSNAYQGQFAPGSTFKVVSTAAAGKSGFSLYGDYACPSEVKIGPQTFRNFESSAYGRISLARAIEVSCNTVFYGIAERMWQKAGGPDAALDAPDPIAEAARTFGLGEPTGIDLPGEAAGRVSSRQFKAQNWEDMKDTWCRNAETGYPETRKTDPKLADYYTALDKENCTDGYQWRAGDALNAAIGQGDTTVTPLQMAMVYAAVANGGKLYQPQIAKGDPQCLG